MPLTLGRGTLHPVFRSRYLDAGNRASGRMRMWEQDLMLDYAATADMNLRLDIPILANAQERGRRGAFVSGLGDISLRGKQRIGGSRGEGTQSQHSVFYGVKLPTGSDDAYGPSHGGVRHRLNAVDQAGTGNPGVLLGYGWTGESLWEAGWASTTWRRDVGGGMRLGDTVEATGTYARWVKRPDEAEDLGFKLSTGLTGVYHTADTRSSGRSSNNDFGYLGPHFTPVVTKGNYILQLGVLIPVIRSGEAHRVDFPYEIRFGVETFF